MSSLLAQGHGALSLKVSLESNVSVFWEIGRFGLVGLLVVGRLFWSLLFSLACFFSRSSSLSLLCGLRPGTGACILLSLSLLYLDDLTMPPYSPHPLPPKTRL